jgi:hypothetical protein
MFMQKLNYCVLNDDDRTIEKRLVIIINIIYNLFK